MDSSQQAYLFGHSLWREVAYEMLTPPEHARLHALALRIYEEQLGCDRGDFQHESRACELAQHAQAARLVTATSAEYDVFQRKEQLYLERCAALSPPRRSHEKPETGQLSRTAGDALRISGRHIEAETWFIDAIARAERQRPWQLAELHAGLATVYMETGNLALAKPMFERAVAEHQSCGNRRAQIVSHVNLATISKQFGLINEATANFARAAEIQAEAGDLLTEAYLTVHVAIFYHDTGRTRVALIAYLSALEKLRELGERRLEGMTLGALANLYRSIGYTARAEAAYLETLALHEAMRDTRAAGIVLGNLASLYQETGREGLAEAAYMRALTADKEAGNLRSEAIARGNLAILYRETGRIVAANRMFMQAIDQLAQIGDLAVRGAFMAHRGTLCLLCGDLQAAAADLQDALLLLDAKSRPAHRLEHALPLALRLQLALAAPIDFMNSEEAPRAASLKRAREILSEMRELLSTVGHKHLSASTKQLGVCEAALREVDAAGEQWRPPKVFRGHLPQELKPALRIALLGWMHDLEAEHYEAFRWQNPELHAAMSEGAHEHSNPDWTSLPQA